MMTWKKLFIRALVLASLLGSTLSLAETTGYRQARDILETMEAYQRGITNSAFSLIHLSSCKFSVTDGKIKCSERPRVKMLESVSVNDGADNKDTKTVTIIREPAAEKGISMLNYSYNAAERDNETWLYLSALGKVKRIANGNSDDYSEPASLFGSEFTTEDLDTGKLDEYELSVPEAMQISGRNVWRIELIPKPERANKTRYGRSVVHVDQERFVALRIDIYDKSDREIKRMLSGRMEKLNGIWFARTQTMMNLINNRLSHLARTEINLDTDVPAEFLTQRTLVDGAFRETWLRELRSRTQHYAKQYSTVDKNLYKE
jgi:hypothetical protein